MVPAVLTLVLIAAFGWWWLSRVRVSPEPVVMMPMRIAFPSLRLDDLPGALGKIEASEDVVIPHEHAVLVIDYPLTNPASIEITAPLAQGFTRSALLRAIYDEYDNVYEAEEGTAATKTVPRDERGTSASRNRTDGVYGIYGHDLSDLVLTAARWTRSADGNVRVELSIESRRA